ncbi:zinc ribbon domain-containing protein [Flavobacterium sp. HBTb2-11-1]|uniref:zinc ribbon domain-containing protein n=1 Tax=Flavobacterium sp. HBTb2-11-1 TaxID=2692212 RepID=UPI0013706830|nr:zinc ribbon domain-containing protein [Flavobacterium sp. HBTb2-11-1]MXO04001.1 hypothetical protein [Flavobacterium sp. HBTb2-11-1]
MNIPNLPDNLHKFLLLGGVLLLIYAQLEGNKLTDNINKNVDAFNLTKDSLNIRIKRNEYQFEKIKKKADKLSSKYGIENPIEIKDSLAIFTQTLKGSMQELAVGDSISKLWEKYNDAKFEIEIAEDQLLILNKQMSNFQDEYDQKEFINNIFLFMGMFLLFSGLWKWQKQQNINDELLLREILDKGKIYPHCQSCGKNFSSIRQNGKNKDKSINNAFCESCYDNGKFVKKMTREEFEAYKQSEIKKQKGWINKKNLKNRLNKLERWKESEY